MEMEKADLIYKGLSAYSSPIIIVKKKPDLTTGKSSLRMCVDYRKLNASIPKDLKDEKGNFIAPFPLPQIEVLLSTMKDKPYRSMLDCRGGFHHILLTKEAQEKSAFTALSTRYLWKRLPFGIHLGPSYFSYALSRVLHGIDGVLFYIDDILILSRTLEEHLAMLRRVCTRG